MVRMAGSASHAAPSGHLADLLIQHVPSEAREQFLNNIIETLEPTDRANLELVTWLVVRTEDPGLSETLRIQINSAISAGDLSGPISICGLYPELAAAIFESMPASIRASKASYSPPGVRRVQSYLSFCKAALPTSLAVTGETCIEIFREALDLLASRNVETARISNDLVSSIMLSSDKKVSNTVVKHLANEIWAQVVRLCVPSEAEKTNSSIGYSLWLRFLSAGIQNISEQFVSEQYWQLILQGLRSGDSERRKICLAIIKFSTIDQPGISPELQQQYNRYCTVFETIVLGHYINQVQECEADLDFLASKESRLPQQWLFVLLASGINQSMQLSNRKFIGNWIMKTSLSSSEEFFNFVEHDFMPWAITGQIFVASLKRIDGVQHCVHGDRLVAMIHNVATSSSASDGAGAPTGNRISSIIIDVLSRKRDSIFAYAVVYLIKGVGEWLSAEQRAAILDLSLHRLPEVARDAITLFIGSEVRVQKMSEATSRRKALESASIGKCSTVSPDVAGLNDLWKNLEYLEFPRDLSISVLKAILNPTMVRNAAEEPQLAASLAEKVKILHRTAENRTYLFATLVTSVRRALLSCPAAFESLHLDQLIVRVARQPPEPATDFLLQQATLNLAGLSYEKYFGERPSLGFAAYLDLLSRLSNHQQGIRRMLDDILHPWKTQKTPPPTVSMWKTTLQLQIILLLCEQLDQTREEADALLQDLFLVLAIEPLPRYRFLLEWICTRLCLKHHLHNTIIAGLSTKDHHSNPKYLASLLKIGCCLGFAPNTSEAFALRLMIVFVPLAASSKVVIRHEAQWQIPVLMDYARQQGWKSITSNEAFCSLDDYIRSLERFDDPPPERIVGRFHPVNDNNMTNLIEGPWFDLDRNEPPLCSHDDLLCLYELDAASNNMPSCLPLGPKLPSRQRTTLEDSTITSDAPPAQPVPTPIPYDPLVALQTKGTAYLSRALQIPTSDIPSDVTSDVTISRSSNNPNTLVMASLIENPTNLGGLSRVSEIFGAGALTLQNQNVLTSKDFRSVSVSSHLHFPIVQLSAGGILAWLAERKGEGFTVVGIEQTDRSLILGSSASSASSPSILELENGDGIESLGLGGQDGEKTDGKEAGAGNGKTACDLPEKVVLVVGSEREGIPARILLECDILVEIPQVGVTRSLNVQTAVAIVLYEHSRQWRGRQSNAS